MNTPLQYIDPVEISDIIDASMIAARSFLCTSSNGLLQREAGLLWARSELVNAVLQTNVKEDALASTIEQAKKHFEHGFEWHLGPSSRPQNYGNVLLSHGLTHYENEPGMALDLQAINENIPLASDLTIIPITSYELLTHWIRTWLFPLPEEAISQIAKAHASLPLDQSSPLQFYLGLLDDKPVATACVFYDGSVAAIHYVVTRPEVRRRGIGGTMTVMAAREAQARGYQIAVLSASPFGINIYRRLGFREYCTLSTYEWNPEEEEPQS